MVNTIRVYKKIKIMETTSTGIVGMLTKPFLRLFSRSETVECTSKMGGNLVIGEIGSIKGLPDDCRKLLDACKDNNVYIGRIGKMDKPLILKQ